MDQNAYQNPVWHGYFADPFVLHYQDTYYAYGTGPADATGREFPILSSPDLIHWTSEGGALLPLGNARAYWAPEVSVKEGRLYLFYSASTTDSDADQRLRVAIADDPRGPFVDTGRLLLPSVGFSIDASPFVDPADGNGYLFFAADFEADHPTGTGLCVVRLADDMISAVGEPRVVLRAWADWQIFEKNRNYKGRVWPAWYCLEGPSVVHHDHIYYCFFSGGAWHGTEYGVGVAVAEHPMGPWRIDPPTQGASVLRGIPGKVIGPGHNSVVKGPDGRTDFMVYHAWNPEHTMRRMCIDPLRWTSSGPRLDGPSTSPKSIVVG